MSSLSELFSFFPLSLSKLESRWNRDHVERRVTRLHRNVIFNV